MFNKALHFITHFKELSISNRNVPLAYLSNSINLFILFLPVFFLWLQRFLDNSQISFLIGWLFLSSILFELPTGAFADLVGKKMTVLAGYLVRVVSIIVYLWAGSFLEFGLAVTLHSLAESMDSGASDALVYDSLVEDGREREYRSIYSKLMVWIQISIVAATFLGGWLGNFGLDVPFKVYLVAVVVSIFLISLMREPAVDTKKFTWRNYRRQTIDGTKHMFHTPRLAKLALLYILVGGIGWTFQRLLRDLMLIKVGYDQFAIGLIGGSFRLVNILFMARLVKSAKILAKGWDILFLPVTMIFTYLIGFWLNSWTSIMVTAGIMMVGSGRFIVLGPYLQHEVESRYRATAISAANMFVGLLLGINMIGIGFILNTTRLEIVSLVYGLVSLVIVLPLALKTRAEVLRSNKLHISKEVI